MCMANKRCEAVLCIGITPAHGGFDARRRHVRWSLRKTHWFPLITHACTRTPIRTHARTHAHTNTRANIGANEPDVYESLNSS